MQNVNFDQFPFLATSIGRFCNTSISKAFLEVLLESDSFCIFLLVYEFNFFLLVVFSFLWSCLWNLAILCTTGWWSWFLLPSLVHLIVGNLLLRTIYKSSYLVRGEPILFWSFCKYLWYCIPLKHGPVVKAFLSYSINIQYLPCTWISPWVRSILSWVVLWLFLARPSLPLSK